MDISEFSFLCINQKIIIAGIERNKPKIIIKNIISYEFKISFNSDLLIISPKIIANNNGELNTVNNQTLITYFICKPFSNL